MAKYGIERYAVPNLDQELTEAEAQEFEHFCMLIRWHLAKLKSSPEAPAEHPRR